MSRLFVTPTDCILPGSSVLVIFQARILEWIAISFSTFINIFKWIFLKLSSKAQIHFVIVMKYYVCGIFTISFSWYFYPNCNPFEKFEILQHVVRLYKDVSYKMFHIITLFQNTFQWWKRSLYVWCVREVFILKVNNHLKCLLWTSYIRDRQNFLTQGESQCTNNKALLSLTCIIAET